LLKLRNLGLQGLELADDRFSGVLQIMDYHVEELLVALEAALKFVYHL
jgi:hypothetical protein